jgi:hypothetical protein
MVKRQLLHAMVEADDRLLVWILFESSCSSLQQSPQYAALLRWRWSSSNTSNTSVTCVSSAEITYVFAVTATLR